jgi:hypothetical protein
VPLRRGKHNVRLICGFNDWKIDKFENSMTPIGNDTTGWFYQDINVPDIGYNFNFCFEADNQFENNNKVGLYSC